MNRNLVFIYNLTLILALVLGTFTITRYFKKKKTSHYNLEFRDKNNILPVAVIGSGPAGLSAALYVARGKVFTTVFQGPKPGGQLTGTSYVENWPGIKKMMGAEIIQMLKEQAQSFGAKFSQDIVESVDFSQWPYKLTTDSGKEIYALSVIISTGASPKKLNIEGEQEYWGKGVTTCAICDAPYHKDGYVVVIGGGDSAAEEALQLALYAKKVMLLVRGSAMRASASMQEKLKEYQNIEIKYNLSITKILGDGLAVNGVETINNKTKEIGKLNVGGVFLAIGHDPNTAPFKDFLKLDSAGYIIVKHPTQETSYHGIYAAGDVVDNRYRQAGVAAGDGIKAALDSLEFLRMIGFSEKESERLESKFFNPEEGLTITEVKEITSDSEYKKEVLESKIPVIIDFYAPYCPSCMQMLPVVSDVASKFVDKVKFLKVNTDNAPELAKKLNVLKVPYILVIKDKQIVYRYADVMTKRQLTDFVNEQLKSS